MIFSLEEIPGGNNKLLVSSFSFIIYLVTGVGNLAYHAKRKLLGAIPICRNYFVSPPVC